MSRDRHFADSRPGVCDICGCAVVRFHEEVHITAIRMGGDTDIDGHVYEAGELCRVRCSLHGERGDIPPAEDAHGGSGFHQMGAFRAYCVEGARMAACCERESALHQVLKADLFSEEWTKALLS